VVCPLGAAVAFWLGRARTAARSGAGSSTITRVMSSRGMEERRGLTRF
jgi:hypothetical protein